jgi:hypothetical protein
MIVKNFINGQITTGTEPIDPISGTSRGLYINSVLSGNSATDTLVGLDINPSYSGTAGNYFGLRVSGDTIFATSGGTLVMRTNNSGYVGFGTNNPTYNLDILTTTGSTTIFRAINPGDGVVNRGAGIVVTMLNTQVTGGRTRISAYDTAGYASGNYIEYVSGNGSLTTEGSTLVHGYYEVGLGVSGTKRLSAGTSGVAITGTLSNTTGAQFATSSGNVLIGTTTDAGYKLDVNGTARTGDLTIGASGQGRIIAGQFDFYYPNTLRYQSAYYLTIVPHTAGTTQSTGGYVAIKADTIQLLHDNYFSIASGTLVNSGDNVKLKRGTNAGHLPMYLSIEGADAAGYNYGTRSGSVLIYPGEQSFDNGYGSVVLAHNGINQRGSVLIGTSTTNNSRLLIGGTVSGATLSTTRATHINATLLATGNTTTLIGLDIQPTFTPGSFTGLTQLALRVSGDSSITNNLVVGGSSITNTLLVGGTSFLTHNTNPTYSIQSQGNIMLMSSSSTNKYNLITTDPATFWMGRVDGAWGLTTILGVSTGTTSYNGVISTPLTSYFNFESTGVIASQTRLATKGTITLDGSANRYLRFWEPGVSYRAVIGHTDNADGGHIVIRTGDATTLSDGTQAMRIFQSTQNVFVGASTTDLGFKLSVSGSTLLRGSGTTSASYALATQNSSGGTTMVVNNAGNMLIGTTTDAGYRLDVNGTVRGQSGLWGGDVFLGNISGSRFLYLPSGYGLYIGSVGNVPTVLGDSTFSTTLNATINRFTLSHTLGSEQVTKLVGGSSVNHLNPVFDIVASVTSSPPKEIDMRIYTDYYSGTQRWGNIILGHNGNNTAGNILMGTNIGNGSRLLVGGTVSGATLNTTRGVHVAPTLLATGNTTTLIGLDIQPTFTPGSFTGLTQLALRVSGGTQIIGSGSTGTTLSLFSVDGASGRLFDVTDDFSNSLFSVNTSSGVPVIEAFANNSIVMGTYGSNTLVVSGTSVSVGTSTSNSTSVLNIVSTTKGVQFPRMTTAQKNSLTGATDILGGLVVFDTNTNKLCCYNGTTWNDLF